MMAGRTYGKGFKGALNYNEDKNHKHEKDVTILEAHGVSSWVDQNGKLCIDSDQVAREFRVQANLDPDCNKPVANWWQAYKPEDTPKLSNELMCKLAKEHIAAMACKVVGWNTLSILEKDENGKAKVLTPEEAKAERQKLKEQGIAKQLPKMPVLAPVPLGELQYVIVRHGEKKHQHTHALVNLVTAKGDRIYIGNDLYRNEGVCKEITRKYGLAWGVEKSGRKPSENYKTSGREARDYVAKKVRAKMQSCTSAKEYVSKLASCGIRTRIGTDSKGKIVTVAYSYTTKDGNVHPFRGSDLGRGYSGGCLRKALEENFQMHRKRIVADRRLFADRLWRVPLDSHLSEKDGVGIREDKVVVNIDGEWFPSDVLGTSYESRELLGLRKKYWAVANAAKKEFEQLFMPNYGEVFMANDGEGKCVPIVTVKLDGETKQFARTAEGWREYRSRQNDPLNGRISPWPVTRESMGLPPVLQPSGSKEIGVKDAESRLVALFNKNSGGPVAVKVKVNAKAGIAVFLVRYKDGSKNPVAIDLRTGKAAVMDMAGKCGRYPSQKWITGGLSEAAAGLLETLAHAPNSSKPSVSSYESGADDEFDRLVRALVESGMTPEEAKQVAKKKNEMKLK